MIPLGRPHPHARYFAPEIVQTSMMDCGPASLHSLVEGFGLSANYGRLREACQTSVDGTSISTMNEIANLLGLDTEEMMIPSDHLLVAQAAALPAIVVVRTPNGANHFVVVWSISGPWIQVMDPAEGRRWVLRSTLFDRLYMHHQRVPASAWRSWVGDQEFLGALDVRLAALAIAPAERRRLRDAALADPGWRAMAALDAAVRMTAAMADSGALERGAACVALIERQVEPGQRGDYPMLLHEYRSTWRALEQDGDEETLTMRGVVLVRARGRRDHEPGEPATNGEPAPSREPGEPAADGEPEPSREPAADGEPDAEQPEEPAPDEAALDEQPAETRLPPELAATLRSESPGLARTLLGMLRADGLLTPAVLAIALVVSAALITIDALLLRGVLELGDQLGLASQRAAAIASVLGFLALGLLVELPLVAGSLRLGRRLDLRLRMAFLTKLPRLDDRYFRSRLLSDMAERGHALYLVRMLPQLGVRLLRSSAQMMLTVAGIAWLAPGSAPLALLAVAVCIGLPLASQPVMAERDLRVRSHAGALGRFYLDALRGLMPIRVHGARAAIQHQQEGMLVQWARAGLRYHAASTMIGGALAVCGLGVAVILVWTVAGATASGVLLLVYWALSVPALGQDIALIARQYPLLRNIVVRLLEPLSTPEPQASAPAPAGEPSDPSAPAAAAGRGVAIELSGVAVEAAGNIVLQDIDLAIAPGEHVAIVGASGAGKSSLVGLLLGWYQPARGAARVDGRELVGDWLTAVRRDTAWVDPAIALWNRSFLDNLRYGADDGELPLTEILTEARLREVLEQLPDGLATELGEGGKMISGGEGQRTRVGRALARPRARLVILDEPFRGLDLTTRRTMLAVARRWWRDATLLWVTHDIAETEAFARVLVIDAGRIAEDGHPAELGARADSRYATLVRRDRELHATEWSDARWRRVWLADGKLRERDGGGS